MPKISIIIPVYNVEQYLRECLDSLVNQTHRDLEIICVNDGSTDGSLAILEEYAAKDSRIVILNKKNAGPSAARNMGLERATGEYVAFCDSDDWLDTTAYEKALVRAQESDADLTQFSFTFVNFPNQANFPIPSIEETNDTVKKIQLVNNYWAVLWCYLWKTSFVKKNKLRFHDDLKSADEITFTFKAAILANKIAILPERLYYYRFRSISLTGNKKESTLVQRPWAFTLLFEDIAECNISEDVRFQLLCIKWGSLWSTYNHVIHKNLRPLFCQNIRKEQIDGEFELLNRHANELDFQIVSFFTLLYSQSWLERLKTRFSLLRGICCDWIVKRLIPYSPWLQMICQSIDSQREEIQLLKTEKEYRNG